LLAICLALIPYSFVYSTRQSQVLLLGGGLSYGAMPAKPSLCK